MDRANSMRDLFSRVGLAPSAPWSMYASCAADTHPIVYLGAHALMHKVAPGCEVLGIDPPLAPRLQVMVDMETDPLGPLAYSDEFSRVEVIDGPHAIRVYGLSASLSLARFASKRMKWEAEEVPVVRIQATNEEFARCVAREGVRPYVFVGVTDGCDMGGNEGRCVNTLSVASQRHADANSLMPEWWVTDHFHLAAIDSALRPGAIATSANPGYPLRFRAVVNLSETWGHYGMRWGLGGTWLFRVEPAS